jgi:NADH dehydrogenase/NADH:ubiquinone oxidoreductase subunit G
MITMKINNTEVQADSLLDHPPGGGRAGITIPTLCYLEGPGSARRLPRSAWSNSLPPHALRLLLTPVQEGMHVLTNSKKAREARRAVVGLLLSEHEGNCQYCSRADDCELKALAKQLGMDEVWYEGEKPVTTIDRSTPALVRDTGKCIKCRRCVTVCGEIQKVGAIFPQNRGYATLIGPAFTLNLDSVACVQCGQCAAVCPVGAITERSQTDAVWAALDDPTKHVVVQPPRPSAPRWANASTSSGDARHRPDGHRPRQLGFDAVFETNFTTT